MDLEIFNLFKKCKFIIIVLLALFNINISKSQEDLGTIEIIGTSPIPGTGIDRNKVPNSTQSIDIKDIENLKANSFADLMGEKLSGITVKDVQNSPFQKNLDYRGFTASPLLGESQGIAVYLNGIRANEGFGDTLQWDLIPETAVKKLDLMSANPVFGLNALGGSLALTTKKGLDYIEQNASAVNTVEAGSFDKHLGIFELGAGSSDSGIYIASEVGYDGGWRDHSPGDIKRIFMNYGLALNNYDLDISFLGADTDLYGNGVTPIEILKKRRESLFTWPDITENKLYLLNSNGSYYYDDQTTVSASIYYRRLIRSTFNADEIDAEECDEDNDNGHQAQLKSDFGTDDSPLCGEDNSSGDYGILIDQYGNAISTNDNIRRYGLINKTNTMTVSWGGAIQTDIQDTFGTLEHSLILGLSADKTRTAFHSRGELGELTYDRTVNNVLNSNGGFIILESEQEHTGANGGKSSTTKRGDIGQAQLASKVDYYGAFITDTITLSDKTDLTLASRANLAYIKLYDHLSPSYSRSETLDGSHRFFRFNPSIGITHNYNQNIVFRANYKESNRTPAPIELSCASANAPCRLPNAFVADPPLEQVVSKGFEFGARGSLILFEHKGFWETTAYHYVNDDDIIFVSSGTGLSSGYFKNFGQTRRRGIELSYSSEIENGYGLLDFYTNYSFLEATFESDHTLPAANHPTGANDVEKGDTLPGMPEHTIKAGIGQHLGKNLRIGINMNASSGVYLRGDESNQLKPTNPYVVFNASTRWTPFQNIEFFGRIDNILNSKYETMGVLGEASASEVSVPISELGDTGSGTAVGVLDPRFLSPGSPLGIFIGLKVRW